MYKRGPLALFYLRCRSVQTALLVLLAAATGARLVATNLDGCHHWRTVRRALATLCQEVGMQQFSNYIIG